MKKLFDESTGLLLLDEMVYSMPSFQKIMEDNMITDEEIMNQSEVVVDLLKKIDTELNEEERELVIKTICEMAVLYQLHAIRVGEED